MHPALEPYRRLLEHYEPYVVARRSLWSKLDPKPLGVEIPKSNFFDPTVEGTAPLFSLLYNLDQKTYGPLGMPMPRWVLYDCAALPGFVFGLARPAAKLPARFHQLLEVPAGYEGPIPISMHTAIPTPDPEHWLGFSVTALSEAIAQSAPPGMHIVTTTLALAMLRPKHLTRTIQWASPKLRMHARFAPLKLLGAWVPTHNWPATCTFRVQLDEARIVAALNPDRPPFHPDFTVDVFDEEQLKGLQELLEGGRDAWLCGPPYEVGAALRAPITYEEPSS